MLSVKLGRMGYGAVSPRTVTRRPRTFAVAAALAVVAVCVVSVVAGTRAASAAPGAYDPYFARGGVLQSTSALAATGVAVDRSTLDVVTSASVGGGTSPSFRVERFTTSGAFVSTGIGAFSGSALAVTTVPLGQPGAGDSVAAGFIVDQACANDKEEPVVAEFTRAGSVVFARAVPVCGSFTGVTVDGSGRIVATGIESASATANDMLVARFESNGFPDTSFVGGNGCTGSPGYCAVQASAHWQASAGTAVAMSGSGSTSDILVGGSVTPPPTGTPPDLAVAEFTSTGALNTGYGTTGITIASPGQVNGIALVAGGDVVAAGLASTTNQFVLEQFNSVGHPTWEVLNRPGLPTLTGWSSVAYQPYGNLIVAAGPFGFGQSQSLGMAVSQFNASTGAINPWFGSSGTVLRQYPIHAEVGGVAVQGDGKTVVAGGAPVPGGGAQTELIVLRLSGPTASVTAPRPIKVTKNGPVGIVFRFSINEALPGNVIGAFCGPGGSLVNRARQCAFVEIPAGSTSALVEVIVAINSLVGTQTRVPLTFLYGNGLTASPSAKTAVAVVLHVPPPPPYTGYWMVATDGGIFNFGTTHFFGSTGNVRLNKPIVGMAVTPDGHGYWLVASDGGIFTFGDAKFYGSTGAVHLNKPIVGMAATPDGHGYWLVATDGGIFTFGDAKFYGSTGAVNLNKPIVAMAAVPDGHGYWLVASDGGIFTFGDARFFGSTGNVRLNRPIVGMAAYPGGGGYWLVATDGGIFTFGHAGFHGSTGAVRLNKPIVAMAATYDGLGYWLVASDGGIFTFGDAGFFGSTGNVVLNKPIVGMAG
jgi:hypothetical protein